MEKEKKKRRRRRRGGPDLAWQAQEEEKPSSTLKSINAFIFLFLFHSVDGP